MSTRKRQKREAVEEEEEEPELRKMEDGPILGDAAAGPPRKVKLNMRGMEREFRFVATVDGLKELDKLRLQHECQFKRAWNRSTFAMATLFCQYEWRRRHGCPYRLLARRERKQHGQKDTIHVFAHSEHNHPIRTAEQVKRATLVPDDQQPPAIFHTFDGLEWHLLKKVDNFRELAKCRQEIHSTSRSLASNATARRFRCRCSERYRIKCPFAILVQRTQENHYLLYTRGTHTCQWATSGNSKKPCRTSAGLRRDQQQVEESEEEFELEAMSSKALPKQKQKKQAKTVVRSCQWNILARSRKSQGNHVEMEWLEEEEGSELGQFDELEEEDEDVQEGSVDDQKEEEPGPGHYDGLEEEEEDVHGGSERAGDDQMEEGSEPGQFDNLAGKDFGKQNKPRRRAKEAESGREERAGPEVEPEDGQMEVDDGEEEARQQSEKDAADRLMKIHRRLGKALRKGKVDRAKKWMIGTEQEEEMVQVLNGICLDNVLILLDMADREMVEDRTSRHFWLPWTKAAFSTRGTSLAKVKGIRTRFEANRIRRLIERLFGGIGTGEERQNEEKPRKKKRQKEKEDEVEEKPKRRRKNGTGTDVDVKEVEEKQRKKKRQKEGGKEKPARRKDEDGIGTDLDEEEEEEEIDERPPKLIRKNAGTKLRVSIKLLI